jgi:site-specific recombinase XerD
MKSQSSVVKSQTISTQSLFSFSIVSFLLKIGRYSSLPKIIQDALGHKNIAHTVRYTATAAKRFDDLWKR